MNAKIKDVILYYDHKNVLDRVNIVLSFGNYTGLSTGSFDSITRYNNPNQYLNSLLKISGADSFSKIKGCYIRTNKMKAGERLQYMQHILYDDIKMNLKGELI